MNAEKKNKLLAISIVIGTFLLLIALPISANLYHYGNLSYIKSNFEIFLVYVATFIFFVGIGICVWND